MSNPSSSLSPYVIPERHSSLARNLKAQRLEHRSSRQELVQKLSSVSRDNDPMGYLQLRIQQVELDQELERLDREVRDYEKDVGDLDSKAHRASRKRSARRLVSLSEDLWMLKRALRAKEEEAGQVALLGPDNEGAFTAALLRLYKDPMHSRKRSSVQQSAMRADSIAAYRCKPATPLPGPKDAPKELRCMLAGRFWPATDIIAAHIVPSSLGPELVDYVCGTGAGLRLYRPDNCLMLNKQIEQAMDDGHLVFIPVDATERPLKRWKMVLTNRDARAQRLHLHPFETLGSLEGKELEFLTEQRPAARFLYYHFIVSLLRCRQYARPGWEDTWFQLRTGRPWLTPGRYLRQSMLVALARMADDVKESELEQLLADAGFQDDGQCLRAEEDEEVARRVFEIALARQYNDCDEE